MTAQSLASRAAPSLGAVGLALGWLIPLLALAGLGIAAYLTFVHYQGIPPVCEGSGGCHTVQSSEYAKLLGVPVATLGLALYAGIFVAAIAGLVSRGSLNEAAPFVVFALALTGVLYSGYLTWLELYRIHAICAWCVASAGLLAATFIAATGQLVASGRWKDELME